MCLVTQAHHYVVFARFPPVQFPLLNDLCKLASPHYCIQAGVKSTLEEKTPTFPHPHPPHDLWLMFETDSWPVTVIQHVISQYYKNIANDFTTPKSLFFLYKLVENQPNWPCSGAGEKHCSQSGRRIKSLHSHNHFYVTKHRGAYESDHVCVCVCVFVCVLSRGPGGGVSASQATLRGEAVLDSTQD